MNKIQSIIKDYANSLVVVTAPSGAGKSTIIAEFMSRHPGFEFCVSHTTRCPRKNEQDGREYYFISKEAFEYKVNQNDFIEYAEVHSHYYGTSFQEVRRLHQNSKKIILDIDVQGSLQLQPHIDALYIFISVPNLDTLRKRLIARGTEDKAELNLRIKNAQKELSIQDKWPQVIVNDDLKRACGEFETIINNYFKERKDKG